MRITWYSYPSSHYYESIYDLLVELGVIYALSMVSTSENRNISFDNSSTVSDIFDKLQDQNK